MEDWNPKPKLPSADRWRETYQTPKSFFVDHPCIFSHLKRGRGGRGFVLKQSNTFSSSFHWQTAMALRSSSKAAKQTSSVQELARKLLDVAPQNYIRDVADNPVSDCCNPSLKVPLVNMANLVNGGEAQEEELHKLYSACRDWGAFQVLNSTLVFFLIYIDESYFLFLTYLDFLK